MKIPVRIADTQKISSTVKSFTLALDGQPFTFLPGQWIDCFAEIDGRTEVAGYSITSSPTEDGWFSIAVKLVGDSAVTDYLHDSAAVGDTLIVEGGQGDFHYTSDVSHPLALIAGGIGITPIASIIRYIDKSALQGPRNSRVQRIRPIRAALPQRIRGNGSPQFPIPRPLQRNPPPQRTLERPHRKN